MYSIKLIDGTFFHIDNDDYKRIIDIINSNRKFIEITARYSKFRYIKILLNVKYVIYVHEE